MLTIAPDMSSMSCVMGNPVVFDFSLALTADQIEPLIDEGRSIALAIYDPDGQLFYIEGETMRDPRGDKVRFAIDGDITTQLASQSDLKFEIAERGQSRDTLQQGEFVITSGAPSIVKNANGALARYLRRVVRVFDPTDASLIKPEYKITTEKLVTDPSVSQGLSFDNSDNSGMIALF